MIGSWGSCHRRALSSFACGAASSFPSRELRRLGSCWERGLGSGEIQPFEEEEESGVVVTRRLVDASVRIFFFVIK